jgi:hypothetical protein
MVAALASNLWGFLAKKNWEELRSSHPLLYDDDTLHVTCLITPSLHLTRYPSHTPLLSYRPTLYPMLDQSTYFTNEVLYLLRGMYMLLLDVADLLRMERCSTSWRTRRTMSRTK